MGNRASRCANGYPIVRARFPEFFFLSDEFELCSAAARVALAHTVNEPEELPRRGHPRCVRTYRKKARPNGPLGKKRWILSGNLFWEGSAGS